MLQQPEHSAQSAKKDKPGSVIMNKEHIEESRRSWAKNIKQFQLKWPDESIIRFLRKTFPQDQRQGVKTLELGCGSGRNALAMCSEGFDVSVVDCNASSVRMVQEQAKSLGIHIESHEADVVALPFPDASFDVVIAWGLLFLLSDKIKKGMIEIRRVLKPGAWLLANWRADDDYFYGKGRLLAPNTYLLDERCKEYGLTDTIYSFYNLEELRRLYAEAGYKITNVERREFWINNLEVRNTWWHIWARNKL